MSKFTWVRNPTIINGLATLYVSKRGSDVTGNGTAQNPFASIAKATSVATADTNIMLGDGEWNEARTSNNRAFNWWGNGKTMLSFSTKETFLMVAGSKYYYFSLIKNIYLSGWSGGNAWNAEFYNCYIENFTKAYQEPTCFYKNCVVKNAFVGGGDGIRNLLLYTCENCVVLGYQYKEVSRFGKLKNCILKDMHQSIELSYNNNWTNGTIPQNSLDSINDASTGQSFADYFNHYDANDWLKCDFTAKEGSANIGKGEKGTTIGLNQGYTMYADNSSNDVFKASNGAVLKNVAWNENLQGYTIVQKEKVSPLGGTFGSHTITLDSSASSENDYYVGLFIGIVGGKGYGQTRLITNYNGASRLCGVDSDWDIVPDSTSVYTISGSIVSAVKDLGKVIKVKRNWTFVENLDTLSDGRWSHFLTHKTADGEMFPVSSYQWEYSIDGNFWYQGQTEDDLVSATDGDNKVYSGAYGDCSADFDEENANPVTMRYIRVSVHIGFNIRE